MAIASMASGVMDMMGQQAAQEKQKQSYDEWFARQEKNRAEQSKKQEQARQLAEQARAQTVEDASGENVAKVQGDEAARLAGELRNASSLTADSGGGGTAGIDTSIADKYLLSGQPTSSDGNETFSTDLAANLNQASREAKERIGHLATAQSYGGSSQGFDRYLADIFQRSGQEIDRRNEGRRGDLAVYGIQQAVEPVQWSYTPGLRIG